ncbi:MAG: LamG-like jellyroll fold domain-containing protein [Cyclobacteriaceae bacterium]
MNRISYPDFLSDLGLPFSVSMWVKVEKGLTSVSPILTSSYTQEGTYYGFFINTTGESTMVSFGDGLGGLHQGFRRSKTYNFSSSIENRWVHLAYAVRGTNDMDIYLNGQNVGGQYSGGGGSSMAKGVNSEFMIGYRNTTNTDYYFKGELDELKIWNYSRSEAEIRNDMCQKLQGDENGLVAYWKFDEGSGSLVYLDNSDISASIQGGVNWVISGAAIGDNSSYSYSLGSQDDIDISYGLSFISVSSQERDELVGYQLYQVLSAPNSSTGASVSFDNGYVGLFPIYNEAKPVQTKITLSSLCSKGDYRYGNDDLSWEPIMVESQLPSFSTNHFSEMVLDLSSENLDSLADQSLCSDESVLIDIESPCVDEYLWSTGSDSSSVIISDAGDYWVDRVISNKTFRSEFYVEKTQRIEEYFQNESLQICFSSFPFYIQQNSLVNSDRVSSSHQGIINGWIDSPGEYWVDFFDNCDVRRDSISIIGVETVPFDLMAEDHVILCSGQFPYELPLNSRDDVVLNSQSQGIDGGSVDKPGTYWIEYAAGCYLGRDSIVVALNEVSVSRIANVFTPNNDGHNDYFEIDQQLLGSTVSIFNRAGRKIVELENYQNTWDGGGLEAGTYYYSIYEPCSTTLFKGWVSILR